MKINFKDILKNISLIQYTILLISIVITFVLADFYNLNKIDEARWIKNTVTDVVQKKIEPNDVCMKNEEIYLNVENINNNFNNSVYIDKLSRTAILTMEDKSAQFGINSLTSMVNYVSNNLEKPAYIRENNEDYINLKTITEFYGLYCCLDSEGNICIYKELLDAEFTKSYVNFMPLGNEYTLHLNTNSWEIKVILDTAYYLQDNKYYTIIVNNNDRCIIGQVLKKNVDVPIISNTIVPEKGNYSFKSMIVNNNDLSIDDKVDINLINLIKLGSSDGKINVVNFEKNAEVSAYAIYSNGYSSYSYDSTITSNMLQNLNSRNYSIQNIINYVVATELDGIVLDFRNLKGSDKEYFEQYIKELAALLHSVNRKLMVYVKQDTDYVDINKIINYVDNIIYVTYLNVSNVPKTAYSIYNIYDIESSLQKLQNIYNVDMSKIILEIPLYSVLWIEKNSIVTAFELYSLRALQNFLKENKVTYNIDKVTGLNYAELNKGSLKYKVWIQDEISIRKNYLLSQKYLLGGIALYKKGYESNYIYNILKGE